MAGRSLCATGRGSNVRLGMPTCRLPYDTVDDLIRKLDEAMYAARRKANDGLATAVWPEMPQLAAHSPKAR
jgi:hypothetical protein